MQNAHNLPRPAPPFRYTLSCTPLLSRFAASSSLDSVSHACTHPPLAQHTLPNLPTLPPTLTHHPTLAAHACSAVACARCVAIVALMRPRRSGIRLPSGRGAQVALTQSWQVKVRGAGGGRQWRAREGGRQGERGIRDAEWKGRGRERKEEGARRGRQLSLALAFSIVLSRLRARSRDKNYTGVLGAPENYIGAPGMDDSGAL